MTCRHSTKRFPSPVPAVGWTGFYIGANFGYGWRDPAIDFTGNDLAVNHYFNTGALPPGVSVDPKGFLGGLQGGYNRQAGRWVLGIEADLDAAAIRGFGEASTGVGIPTGAVACIAAVFPCTLRAVQFTASGEQKLDAFGTLRGRAGVLFGDRFLAFATGGLAFGEAVTRAAVTNTSSTLITFLSPVSLGYLPVAWLHRRMRQRNNTQWLIGWTIGGGGRIRARQSLERQGRVSLL